MAQNTRLKALEAEVRAAEASILLARKARLFDFSLGLMADVKMNPTLYRPLGTLSLPIWRDKIAAQIAEAEANAKAAGVTKLVRFRNEDLFEAEFKEATVVTLYLWPWINLKLKPRLLAELKPGTRIVSHYHDMGDWPPEKEMEVEGHRIYFWRVPEPSKK